MFFRFRENFAFGSPSVKHFYTDFCLEDKELAQKYYDTEVRIYTDIAVANRRVNEQSSKSHVKAFQDVSDGKR